MSNTTTVGCIGIGHMGGAIAQRLLDAGCSLVVCDPSAEARAPLVARGARVARDPAEVADAVELSFGSLPSVELSIETVCGARGLVQGKRLRCHVETATIGRSAMQRIAAALAARGMGAVDAPVSGGPGAARAGTLSIMIAGAPEAVLRARPALAAISRRLFEIGPEPGQAQLCKLVNNALSLVGMALACEATVVGAKAGLDATTMLEVINASTGRNGATLDKFPQAILTRTFDYGGPMGLAVKDLQLFLDEANGFGIPAHITEAGLAMWRAAGAEREPDRDFTTVIRHLERIAGVEVAGRSVTHEVRDV